MEKEGIGCADICGNSLKMHTSLTGGVPFPQNKINV